jgi:hypothetical protein
MIETFNGDPDTQKLFNFIVATVDKCGLKPPDLCAAPDGSVISATFVIGNFDDVWYNGLNEGNKTALTMGVSSDIANEVGVPPKHSEARRAPVCLCLRGKTRETIIRDPNPSVSV